MYRRRCTSPSVRHRGMESPCSHHRTRVSRFLYRKAAGGNCRTYVLSKRLLVRCVSPVKRRGEGVKHPRDQVQQASQAHQQSFPIIALSRDAFRGRPSSSRRSQATSCSSLPASVCHSRMYARSVSCKGEEMFVPRCHYVAFQSSSSDLFGTSGWPSCGASTDVTVSLYF